MSKERSPLEVCSTTIGTRFISFSLHLSGQHEHLLEGKLREVATEERPPDVCAACPERADCNAGVLPTRMSQGHTRPVRLHLEFHVDRLVAIARATRVPGKSQKSRRIPPC